jgi:hypothetical protein
MFGKLRLNYRSKNEIANSIAFCGALISTVACIPTVRVSEKPADTGFAFAPLRHHAYNVGMTEPWPAA